MSNQNSSRAGSRGARPFELPAGLVVATVVQELARVTVRAKARLLVVLADVRLVVDAQRRAHVAAHALRTQRQTARIFFPEALHVRCCLDCCVHAWGESGVGEPGDVCWGHHMSLEQVLEHMRHGGWNMWVMYVDAHDQGSLSYTAATGLHNTRRMSQWALHDAQPERHGDTMSALPHNAIQCKACQQTAAAVCCSGLLGRCTQAAQQKLFAGGTVSTCMLEKQSTCLHAQCNALLCKL